MARQLITHLLDNLFLGNLKFNILVSIKIKSYRYSTATKQYIINCLLACPALRFKTTGDKTVDRFSPTLEIPADFCYAQFALRARVSLVCYAAADKRYPESFQDTPLHIAQSAVPQKKPPFYRIP